MTQEILINVGVAETRVAVVEEGRLEALSVTRLIGTDGMGGHGARSAVGDIVLGRVLRVLPGIQAAFVEIGHGRAGFLGAREARSLGALDTAVEPAISELVGEGDILLVQITKDPVGEKGARLTTSVSLPGRLCVLTPYQKGIAVSRRIASEAERARLQALGEALLADAELVPEAGYIFRTATVGAVLDDLRHDALELAEEWRKILAAQQRARAPATLYRDVGPIERAMRDIVREDTERVLIDDAAAAQAARAYCEHAMPELEDRIAVFEGPGALFDLYDLETVIDALSQARVALPCGGWITIEHTEALTAIDVNSGSFVEAGSPEDTGLAVNLEAAGEIGRQVRLRGIGGMIVVDFIHIKEPGHRERILLALEQSLAKDGTPVTVTATQSGMAEITRKRVRRPLEARLTESCGTCGGSGALRRPDAIAMDVLRRVEATARAAPGQTIHVHAAPPVIAWLEGLGEELAAALARKGIFQVELTADPTASRERFDVSTER
ncbi:MAG: Rne/Rng family ribonuclease [Alphaproteobacteria bacterium]|nr:Rne/Rng family ribonuclease [Alphaproteobacteria bacterium]